MKQAERAGAVAVCLVIAAIVRGIGIGNTTGHAPAASGRGAVGEVDQIDIDEDGQAHAWVVLHDNVTIGTKLYHRPAPGVPEVAREALERIASWNEHPAMLGVDYGSNGVRDYYRKIAGDALAAAQAKGGEHV